MTKNLEKMVFLTACWKKTSEVPSDYHKTYGTLDESEKEDFTVLSNEIHKIWNAVNAYPLSFQTHNITSVDEYVEVYEKNNGPYPYSELIKVLKDFGFSLKNTITSVFRNNYIELFGNDKFNEIWGDTDIED